MFNANYIKLKKTLKPIYGTFYFRRNIIIIHENIGNISNMHIHTQTHTHTYIYIWTFSL